MFYFYLEFNMLIDADQLMSDDELNSFVEELHSESPAMGISMVIGQSFTRKS